MLLTSQALEVKKKKTKLNIKTKKQLMNGKKNSKLNHSVGMCRLLTSGTGMVISTYNSNTQKAQEGGS
jgi:hypothetical protein